jgi:radical SAM superfamily enzyme YgiQ (UPF0313 family)
MKNNKILLINPWIYDFAAYDFWIKPVGLLSIGHYLEKHGYQTYLIDCLDRFHPLNPVVKNKKYGTGKFIRTPVEKPKILDHVPRKYCRYGMPIDSFLTALNQIPEPDVILVTSGMTYWYQGAHHAIQILKEKFPHILVVLGGIYATLCYEHAVQFSKADYVINGGGEIAALNLVDSLTGNDHEIEDKVVPFPVPNYHHYQKLASVPIFTSMGCPYRCSFCASHLLSGQFRQRNPEEVIDEIDYYYHKRHIRHFAFFDDALLMNQEKHISTILDVIIKKQLHINFHTPNGIHAQQITKDLALKLFKSNFKTIRFSYETSNKARQREMGFKVTDDHLANAIDYLASAGFRRKDVDVYVIMGLPDQTFEEVVTSMIFVTSLGAKVKLTSFSPIPGTNDWKRSIELYNLPADIDPLLTNNSIFPLSREDFSYDMFQQIKNLSKVLNYGLDHGINFFNKSELATIVTQINNRQ